MYTPSEKILKQIEVDFVYHAPKGNQAERYVTLREAAKEYALLIAELTPESRDQSLALTHLKLTSMLVNSAIACNE